MNVHMTPIPWGTGNAYFHKQIKLYLDDLGIYAFHYHIFSNRNNNQGYNNRGNNQASRTRSAIVILPSVELGEIFLKRYGAKPSSRIARNGFPQLQQVRNPIQISKVPIICTLARNPVPAVGQIHMVLGLVEMQNNEAARRKQQVMEKIIVIKQKEKEFTILSMECGVWNFDPETHDSTEFVKRYEVARRGAVKFRPTKVIIQLDAIKEVEVNGVRHHYGTPEQKKHLLVIPNHSILSIDTNSRTELFFTLHYSPRIYRCTPPRLDDLDKKQTEKLQRVPGLDDDHRAYCRISFVYKVVLAKRDTTSRIISLGGKAGIQPINPRHIKTILPVSDFVIETAQLLRELSSSSIYPFPVAYQLHSLFANGTLPPASVLYLLPHVRQMLKIHNMDPEMVAEAIQMLSGRHAKSEAEDYIGSNDPLESPDVNRKEHLLEILIEKGKILRKRGLDWQADLETRKETQALIYRTCVTPTGIYSQGPTFEPQNRVLRKYQEFQDHFMRVTFSEEDGELFHLERDVDSSIIMKLFRERLDNFGDGPIQIGGRLFRFLGFSSSSLKSLTCWFMADFVLDRKIMTPERLIQQLGDFDHIQTPGRYAARIGQAFSDTINSIHVDLTAEVNIPDVKRRGADGVMRIFSDGIGKVSMGMVERIWAQSRDLERDRPTVFQIRYGGAKGVIALDSTLEGDQLCLRKSMVKFEGSADRNIEICTWSGKRGLLTLNRPMIKVLEDLKVSSSTFLDLQKQAVDLLYRSSQSPANAAKFFQRQNVSSPILRLPWVIDVLQNVDINFWDDPFLRQGLEIALATALRDYKYKARIPVEGGVTLMGVLDETGFLREGEVYVSFEKDDGQLVALTGRTLVTRSPQYHPGDCQMATAVAAPINSPLRHLKNCIAFSQRGDRPLPGMLSGGDLDGDLYNIIWDPRFHLRQSFTPDSYPPAHPHSLGRAVTLPDVADFFIDFMENNLLGMIATRHLIIADQESNGVFSKDCLKLSQLASTAVDFPKTGHKVEMQEIPRAPSQARPDFLASGPRVFFDKHKALIVACNNALDIELNEGEDDDFGSTPQIWYKSDKTLGKLYRAIDEEKFVSDIGHNITALVTGTRSTVLRNIWDYMTRQITRLMPEDGEQQWHRHVDDASKKREEYILQMRHIAVNRSETPWKSQLTEIEVFMGTILGRGLGASSKRQFDRVQLLRTDYNVLADHTVKWMRGESREELIGRAMASLYIALMKERDGWREHAQNRGNEGTRSWPWCAVCVLMAEVDQIQKEERARVSREGKMGVGATRKRAEKLRRKKEQEGLQSGNGEDDEREDAVKENVIPTLQPLAVETKKLKPTMGLEEIRRQLETMGV